MLECLVWVNSLSFSLVIAFEMSMEFCVRRKTRRCELQFPRDTVFFPFLLATRIRCAVCVLRHGLIHDWISATISAKISSIFFYPFQARIHVQVYVFSICFHKSKKLLCAEVFQLKNKIKNNVYTAAYFPIFVCYAFLRYFFVFVFQSIFICRCIYSINFIRVFFSLFDIFTFDIFVSFGSDVSHFFFYFIPNNICCKCIWTHADILLPLSPKFQRIRHCSHFSITYNALRHSQDVTFCFIFFLFSTINRFFHDCTYWYDSMQWTGKKCNEQRIQEQGNKIRKIKNNTTNGKVFQLPYFIHFFLLFFFFSLLYSRAHRIGNKGYNCHSSNREGYFLPYILYIEIGNFEMILT